jgi:DNA-binding transcriptional MerR regulator
MTEDTPIYNLKAVINETGLNAATLRAWERRYALVQPHRSPGGHRLYSRRDIELIKWLVARQKEGLSISQAVELWKTRQDEARSGAWPTQPSMDIPSSSETMLDALRQKWVTACLAFDDQAANQVLDQAFALTDVETICLEVLQKGLALIGESWYNASVSVQQEHFASAIAMRRLSTLLDAVPAPVRQPTILATCPPGEDHDFILLMVTYLLRRKGWNVLYLGSNVPLEHLDNTIKSTHPALVISAAQTLTAAASLKTMSQFFQSHDLPVAYGGGIFTQAPAATRYIPGYYLGTNIKILPQVIELLVVAPPDLPEIPPISPQYLLTFDSFIHFESPILAQVADSMGGTKLETVVLEYAIEQLTQTILAALRLGDIHLMDFTLSWVDGLLANYGLSKSLSRQLYSAYHRAVEQYLGDQGALVLDWLAWATSAPA